MHYQVVEELRLFLGRVPDFRQRDTKGQDILRCESRTDLSQAPETLNKQPRSNEQNYCNGQLCDYQHTASAIAARSFHRAAPAFLECFRKLSIRRMKCRNKTEDCARQQRNYEGERDNSPVEPDLHGSGNIILSEGNKQIRPPDGQQQSQGTAGEREQ